MFNGRYNNGNTSANVIYDNGGPFVLTSQGHFHEDRARSNWELDLAFKKRDMCFQAKTSSFEAFGLSYTQPVLNGIGLGGEVYVSPFQDKGRLKFIGRYSDKESKNNALATLTTGMGPDQLTLSFNKKVAKSLHMMTEADFSLDRNPKSGNKVSSVLKMGYHFKSDLPGTSIARGIVDTTGNVCCVIEDAVSEAMQLTVTAKINYFKNLYDFGFGILISV